MSNYVLIHGAWHGAWCWYKMLPLLKRVGHDVIAPDLPGLGKDMTPIDQISLESWTKGICEIVVAQPNPVVLVGHSRGGGLSLITSSKRREIGAVVPLASLHSISGQADIVGRGVPGEIDLGFTDRRGG